VQHFPDSPARSAWVVPLGFAISVPALAWSGGLAWRASSTVYAGVLGVLVAGGSYGAWQWLERHPEWASGGHSHGEQAASDDVVALQVARVIEIRMDDAMRFSPDTLEVQAGQGVLLRVQAPREEAQANRQQSAQCQGTNQALIALLRTVAEPMFERRAKDKEHDADCRSPERAFAAEKTVVDGPRDETDAAVLEQHRTVVVLKGKRHPDSNAATVDGLLCPRVQFRTARRGLNGAPAVGWTQSVPERSEGQCSLSLGRTT
jgi:hypothetical protein